MESTTTRLPLQDASPASYIASLSRLLTTILDSPQKHRISLHPYMSTKSQAPHRKLFAERKRFSRENELATSASSLVSSSGARSHQQTSSTASTEQNDDAWLLGDLAYVTTDT